MFGLQGFQAHQPTNLQAWKSTSLQIIAWVRPYSEVLLIFLFYIAEDRLQLKPPLMMLSLRLLCSQKATS